LVRDADAWRVAAMIVKDENAQGRAFSHAILAQVLAAKRTFYMPAGAASGSDSLVGVQGVVASPIIDAKDEVIGVVYGTRNQRTRGRELGPLEAQVVQLLAVAVGAGPASPDSSGRPRRTAYAGRKRRGRKPPGQRATSWRW